MKLKFKPLAFLVLSTFFLFSANAQNNNSSYYNNLESQHASQEKIVNNTLKEVDAFEKRWAAKDASFSMKNAILHVSGVFNKIPMQVEIDFIKGTQVFTEFPNDSLRPVVVESTFSTKNLLDYPWITKNYTYLSSNSQKIAEGSCQYEMDSYSRATYQLTIALQSGNQSFIDTARSNVIYTMNRLISCMEK